MKFFISFHSEYVPGMYEDCPKPYLLDVMLKRLNNQLISLSEFYNMLRNIRYQIDEIDDQFWNNSRTSINVEFHPDNETHLIEFSFSYYLGTLKAKHIY